MKTTSILTVFTFAFYMVASIILINNVKAATLNRLQNNMSRIQVSAENVTHAIDFQPISPILQNYGVMVHFPSEFEGTDLGVDDVSIAQVDSGACSSWTENVTSDVDGYNVSFECDTPAANGDGYITIYVTNDLDNPAVSATYEITVRTYDLGADTDFGGGDDVLVDYGSLEVPIVDDDTVNVEGFIDTFIAFDIDTSSTDEDCDSVGMNACDSHSTAGDGAGYVVNLGMLNTASVSDSGDTTSFSDGSSGVINYIWFDASTNASRGMAITLISNTGQNDLDGPQTNNISALEEVNGNFEIRSVPSSSSTVISAGSGLYGFAFASDDGGLNTVTSGDVATIYPPYDQFSPGSFGYIPSSLGGGDPSPVLNAFGPLNQARVQYEIAASPDSLDGTGVYTDSLTFVATGIF